MFRRGARAVPAFRSACSLDVGMALFWATIRPRSVIVTVFPAIASATTAEAFCFSARMPTELMCFVVAPGPDGGSGSPLIRRE